MREKKFINDLKKIVKLYYDSPKSFYEVICIISGLLSSVIAAVLGVAYSETSWSWETIAIIFFILLLAIFVLSKAKVQKDSRLNKLKITMLNNNEDRAKLILKDDIVGCSDNISNDINDNTKEAYIKQKVQDNILQLMLANMAELREYYYISKNHAKLSFTFAIINSILGIALLCYAVYYSLSNSEIQPVIISVVSGAVSEIFAATSLVIHNKTLVQLNHYYNALHENEMFLSTVNLVGNLSVDKQDEAYMEIIRNELEVRCKKIQLEDNKVNDLRIKRR